LASHCATASRPTPAFASVSMAAIRLPRCGGDPASACARRRRFWCTSSGEVGEVREVRERAHDRERLRDAEVVQLRGQLAPDGRGALRIRAPEADGRLPDALHALEDRVAVARSHGVAEIPSEEARVLAQGQVVVRFTWHF
jgi:hypothetical protein